VLSHSFLRNRIPEVCLSKLSVELRCNRPAKNRNSNKINLMMVNMFMKIFSAYKKHILLLQINLIINCLFICFI